MRHRQVAGVLVDLVAPVLAFALELLEPGHDPGHQLHDDRGVDVRVHPRAMIEKVARPPPENRFSSCRKGCDPMTSLERVAVDARHRHVREHAHDDEHPQDEEDAAPDVRRAKGVDEGVEHGLLGPRSASAVSSVSGSSAGPSGVAASAVAGSSSDGPDSDSAVSASSSVAASAALGHVGRARPAQPRTPSHPRQPCWPSRGVPACQRLSASAASVVSSVATASSAGSASRLRGTLLGAGSGARDWT